MPINSKLAHGFVLFISKVTTRVKPAKLPPQSQPREPAKNHRDSVAWAQETLANRDVSDTYTQVQRAVCISNTDKPIQNLLLF